MKVFRLCIRNIRQLYSNQRGLLFLLVSIQMIAVVIVLLVLGLVFRAMDDDNKMEVETKMFDLRFDYDDDLQMSDVMQSINKMKSKYQKQLYSIGVELYSDHYIKTNGETIQENSLEYESNYKITACQWMDGKERVFPATKTGKVAIINPEAVHRVAGGFKVGDFISVYGENFEVIALDELEAGCRIWFDYLPSTGRVSHITFWLHEQPSKQLTKKMLADIEELFPVREVWEPEPRDLMKLQYIFISYIVCSIVIFLVVYNIRMLFSYMLLQQKKEIEVMFYTGASRKLLNRTFTLQQLLLLLFSMIPGLLMTHGVLYPQMDLQLYTDGRIEAGILALFAVGAVWMGRGSLLHCYGRGHDI